MESSLPSLNLFLESSSLKWIFDGNLTQMMIINPFHLALRRQLWRNSNLLIPDCYFRKPT